MTVLVTSFRTLVPIHPSTQIYTPMSPTPTSLVSSHEPGQLLKELEKRQDEVLQQLDELDSRLREVLEGLGVSIDEEVDSELL
jgi:hypothetical protein